MKLEKSHLIIGIVIITLTLGVYFEPLAVFGNTETVKPQAYNYWGTVKDYHLMDGSSGYGDFKANENGYTMYRNTNDPFTKADYAEGYINFKLEYADVSANDHGAFIYLDVYPDGQSSNFLTYLFYCVDFDGFTHWKTVTTYQKLSYFDTNNDGVINYAVLRHKSTDPNTVRIYELQYKITFDEPEPDPCLGVTCPDDCVGEYWATNGECDPDTGRCVYANKEKIDGKCGYEEPTATPTPDPCVGVTCDPYCEGTTYYYNGYCDGGECQYQYEYNSAECVTETPTGTETGTETSTPTPTGTPDDGDDDGDMSGVLWWGGGIIVVLLVLLVALRSKK